MTRRIQRGGLPDYAPKRPTATTSGNVPGNRDIIYSPGDEPGGANDLRNSGRSAAAAGTAVAEQFGGRPGMRK